MNIQKGVARKADKSEAKARKREAKKQQIAQSAISALKTYGYAQTTLRDIAEQSELSLGMLHYYFEDKEELLIYCVRLYKEEFIRRMQGPLEDGTQAGGAVDAFALALAETIAVDAEIHRLWYDIRSQSMFDPTFEPVVRDLEASMAEMVRVFCQDPTNDDEAVLLYAQLDGVFRFILQKSVFGNMPPKLTMKTMFFDTIMRSTSAGLSGTKRLQDQSLTD